MTPNDVIAGGYRSAKGLLHRFADDLSPSELLHQPTPGSNSAAWIIGHLALSVRRAAERIGVSDLPPIPEGFVERFSQTGKPAEDQSGLGDPTGLLPLFDAHLDTLLAAIEGVPPERMAEPPPQARPFVTNFAEALLFGSLHVAVHAGQLSMIRRSLGKPPVV
jgi:hypothetical protein